MPQMEHVSEPDVLVERHFLDVNKGKRDLIVLRYMLHRLHEQLQQQGSGVGSKQLLLNYVAERRQRTHRIAIYRPQEFYHSQSLLFVGFVSQKKALLPDSITKAIGAIDTQLVAELMDAPGLLSYSSLELRVGSWYNLVVLKDAAAKKHFQRSKAHRIAAYELAPGYYDSIRLHNGILTGGPTHGSLTLQLTHYYQFRDASLQPDMRLVTYSSIA